MTTFSDAPGQRSSERPQLPPPVPNTPDPKVTSADPLAVAFQFQGHLAGDYTDHLGKYPREVDADAALAARGDFASANSFRRNKDAFDAAVRHIDAKAREVDEVYSAHTAPRTADAQAFATRLGSKVQGRIAGLSPGEAADAMQQMIADAKGDDLTIRVLVEDLPDIAKRAGVPPAVVKEFLSEAIPEVATRKAALKAQERRLAVLRKNQQALDRAVHSGTKVPQLFDPADFA